KDVVKNLTHDCDGLIFTPVRDPYTIGTSFKLLKWKPLEFNSADFLSAAGIVILSSCGISFATLSQTA
ncbi:MAG: hypothetical protein IJF35_03670, partial [Clostridia bacterium]|nr:hypothetical protein [Clostridia bacterium]